MTALPSSVSKTHLDNDTDGPLQARAELENAIDAINTLRDFLTNLLGADGTAATALAALGISAATTSLKGLVELATTSEAQAGSSSTLVVTPVGLASAMGSIVAATSAIKGIIEIATNAEVQAGVDTTRAITAANLKACTATTSRRGVAEIATSTEVQAGTDATRIVTPATLKACAATTSRRGVVELATDTQAIAGTSTTLVPSVAALNAVIDEHIANYHTSVEAP